MKLTEIFKDAFLFPSKKIGRFAIYLLLSVFMVLFAFGGFFTYSFGFMGSVNYLLGVIYIIISILIGFILGGYHIIVIKSGIELDDEIPGFEFVENFKTGYNNVVVLLVYFIIPALIVAFVAYETSISSNITLICQDLLLQLFNVYILGTSVDVAVNAFSQTLVNSVNSIAVTLTIVSVLFVIFTIIQSMAEARLANTGDLKEALNIFGLGKDMVKIGLGKVILFIILMIVFIAIIQVILVLILNNYTFLLLTFEIIIIPYMVLVTQRALGLLYSDIA